MNILKPQKILFGNLKKINDLLEEVKEKEELENIELNEYKAENIECNDITIEKSIINNTNILSSNLEKNSFTDIEFFEYFI